MMMIHLPAISTFAEHIEPCGFNVIPFEGFVSRKVGDRVMQFLEPENVRTTVNKNYELGQKYILLL